MNREIERKFLVGDDSWHARATGSAALRGGRAR
jgi:CYTH domain-containing protein